MSRRRTKTKKRRESGPFLNFLKWLGLFLLVGSLWALVATDSVGGDRLVILLLAVLLTLVLAVRLLYLLNLARINHFCCNDIVDELSGLEFEHFCAGVLKRCGLSHIRVTRSSGDFGADIVAEDKDGAVWVFQCKRYDSKIGNAPIQEVTAAKLHYNAQYAAVMTNRHFTPAARQLAEENGVVLIDREKLFKMNRQRKAKLNPTKETVPFNSAKRDAVSGLIILDDHLDD